MTYYDRIREQFYPKYSVSVELTKVFPPVPAGELGDYLAQSSDPLPVTLQLEMSLQV